MVKIRHRICGVSLATAILAAGCGGVPGGTGAQPPATRPATGSHPAATASPGPTAGRTSGGRCLASQLRLTAGPRVAEASEQHTLVLVFRNTSARGCTMQGHPGIMLLGTQGSPLGFTYQQHGDQMITGKAPAPVPLPPGGDAYSALNKNTCAAGATQTAAHIRVTPPDGRTSLSLTLPRYPILGYCRPGQFGHAVDIAPIEPTLAAVLAHH